jgi:nitric oxide reductase subunit B
MQGMWWRELFGTMFAAGFVILMWDLWSIGRHETRPMQVAVSQE